VAARSRRVAVGLALTVSLLAGGAGPAYAAHRRDRCRYEDCGDRYGDGGSGGGQGASGGDYGHGKNGDQGDAGRDQCHSFCNNVIIIPDPTKNGDQPPPKDQQPKQLFPPSPAGIRDFVVSTVKSGIELGRVFADTTIAFVENLMLGLA
jgi:hypothetical protein